MGKTSTAVKRKYNAKTYTSWRVDLKNDFFSYVEKIREQIGLSRPEFLKMLLDYYTSNNNINPDK